MTSNIKIPKILKDKEMSAPVGIKAFVGRRMNTTHKFMGDSVQISKLTVAEIQDIQDKVKNAGDDEAESFGVLKLIVSLSVEGGKDLTEEDFSNFPLEELSKLSQAIMKFSGFGDKESGK